MTQLLPIPQRPAVDAALPQSLDNRPHILYLMDDLWGLGGAESALLRIARLLPDRYRCTIGTFRLRPASPGRAPWPIRNR